jgi:hypothetical protein
MQLFVTHNGRQLTSSNDEFVHNGETFRYRYSCSSERVYLSDPAGGNWREAMDGDYGLSLISRPDYFVMNRRTGTEIAIGQHLPNGNRVDSIAEDSHFYASGVVYTSSRIQYQADFIPISRFDEAPPTLPPYKRGCEFDPQRETGHMLIDGEWRPYREVRQLNGFYYWTRSHVELDGAVVAIADTVVSATGRRFPITDAVEYEGATYGRTECVDFTMVDVELPEDAATLVPVRLCASLYDCGAAIIRRIHPVEDLGEWVPIPLVGPRCYADEGDTVLVMDTGEREYHPRADTDDWNGRTYSQSWLYDHTFECECCEERYDNDDYSCDGRCVDCDEESEDSEGDHRIRDYSSRSAERFDPEEDIPIKFGIEFEVESASGERSEMLDEFDRRLPSRYAIYKSDGSLSDYNGVEVVTRPDSPAVHKRIWKHVLASSALRDLMRCSSNCGIHIHVSRAPLKPLRIGRMLVFLNDPANRDLVLKVAGRYGGTYSEYRTGKRLADGRVPKGSRYEALNLCSDKTIEFRLFASAKAETADGFIKNIEFVEALLAFTDVATSGNRGLTTAAFRAFVAGRRKDWPALHKHINA